MSDRRPDPSFQAFVEQHLDAAYNLARWLTRDPHEADDCVQEACLRALRFFGNFRGGEGRAWLLAIVRNTCYTRLKARGRAPVLEYDEAERSLVDEGRDEGAAHGDDPLLSLLREADARQIEAALLALPVEWREILVLREMEELPYKQIADVLDMPIGTVMSRLSRARERMRQLLRVPP